MKRVLIYIVLVLLVACGAAAPKSTPQPSAPSVPAPIPAPKVRTARVLATHPHDPKAYTQGLLATGGKAYESTGEYGRSTLRQVDLKTGKVLRSEALSGRYFGEGLAADDRGNLYQLTWREGKAFVYDAATFTLKATYDVAGEGWGLVWHADELYLSDGSATIKVLDPATFQIKRTIDVRSDRGPVEWLNELEWVEGRIWANVYTTPLIAVVDPATGVVEEWIDCSALDKQVANPERDVMNGIAYDSVAKKVYVTGKNWDKLFQIE